MTKPSAPAQEWVCVPMRLEISGKLRGALRRLYLNMTDVGWQRAYETMLAAAPDSGMVAVPREIAQALAKIGDIVTDAEWAKVHNAADCLRALLSRAGGSGGGKI